MLVALSKDEKLFQSFKAFNPIQYCSRFQSFKTFNHCVPFKTSEGKENKGAARFREFSKRSLSTFLAEAKKRHHVKLFGFRRMPNHFTSCSNLRMSKFMQWLLTSHVRRYHQHYGTSGHIWEGGLRVFRFGPNMKMDGTKLDVPPESVQIQLRRGLFIPRTLRK